MGGADAWWPWARDRTTRKRAAKAWQAQHGCSYQQALQAVDGKRRAPAMEHRATTGSGKTFALAHAVQRRVLEKAGDGG
ncbi:hypothetical protein GCM10009533_17940 [Saccharopolyspora spinosporotrichia]|uniref:Helicase/UvrB N-terminal domain-containing protein n=1 Tax=Saccharopolyspora erythraea TaxID=1836 RepID=A0ABN1CIY6_SACER